MFDLTWLVLDFLLAIILFMASIVIIPLLADRLGLKIIFKIERLTKKEIINKLEKDIKLAQANKSFLKGVK